MIEIRKEKKEDYDAVQIVNDRAFGTPEEGRIINIGKYAKRPYR